MSRRPGIVLVPYRGLIYFNGIKSYCNKEETKVLVPYRGLIYFNLMQLELKSLRLEFSSPIGDLFILMKEAGYKSRDFSFSSPIGDLFILIDNAIVYFHNLKFEFSSPIGDLFILIVKKQKGRTAEL